MWRFYLLTILLLVSCLGCGEIGAKQTLVFQAKPLPGASGPIDMDTTVRMVKARVAGTKIRKQTKVNSAGLNRVEVAVYGATAQEMEKLKEFVTASITLEFAGVAHRQFNSDLAELVSDAEREIYVDGKLRAAWLPVPVTPEGKPTYEFDIDPAQADEFVRDRDESGKRIRECLVVYEPEYRVTGNSLENTYEDIEPGSGRPCISFSMKPDEIWKMSELSRSLRGRKLAIIVDGKIHSAPMVQSVISQRGQVTGTYTQEEVERMVTLLRAGSFPCQLTFVEIKSNANKTR